MNFRVVNRPDIVPRLPPLYDPAGNEIDVDSTAYPVVAHRLACYHTLTTYLWLLDQQVGVWPRHLQSSPDNR